MTLDEMAEAAGLKTFQKLMNPPIQCFEGTRAQWEAFARLVVSGERMRVRRERPQEELDAEFDARVTGLDT